MSDKKRPPSRLVLGTGAKRTSTTSRADTLLVTSALNATAAKLANSRLLLLTKTAISRSLMVATQWSHLDLNGLMETPLHLLQPLLSSTILDVSLLETLATARSSLRSTDLLQSHWRHHCDQFVRQNPQVPLTKDDPTESYDQFWRRLMEWHQQKTARSGHALRELYKKDSSIERHNTKVISTISTTGKRSGMDAVRMRLLNHTKTKTAGPTSSGSNPNTTTTITRRLVTRPRLIPPKK